jgi:hypothetical protein
MELINRYVTEVGKHLPRKNRLDIEAELRSTLEDMLEDRSKQTGRPVDESLATELLQDYGAPRKVAAKYQTHPYLIGPRMFPMYTLVLKIALFAVTLGLSIATVVSIISSSMNSPQMLEALGKFAASLVSALIATFGNVTLVFAILERFLPSAKFKEVEKWTPEELTKEPDTSHVSMSEMIFSIVFTAAALIIFNFYPQIVGIWNLENGVWVQIASLSDAFFRYLPWINLSGVLTIALDIWLLRQETWSTLTRWMNIGLQIIGIGIASAMLRGPSLLTLYPGTTATQVGNEYLLTTIFDRLVPVILIIVIVAAIFEIVKQVRQLTRKETFMLVKK